MSERRGRGSGRIWIVVAVAFAALAGRPPRDAAAAADEFPPALAGSISWEYAYGNDGQFGYKSFDFSETFTWSGALRNETPGVSGFARYASQTGNFAYTGTQTSVTTPSESCDTTDTVTRSYSGTSFDRVELAVYLGADPHAILKARCGTSSHQRTVPCSGEPGDSDFDEGRILGHGDSGSVGTVRSLPKGRIEVTFDFRSGSKTGRPFEYERIVARFVLPAPCKVDLDAKGIPEGKEASLGALVVKTTERIKPPRQQVTLRRVKGITDDLLLQRSSNRIRVFTARDGGSEIAFDGSGNRFPNEDLPKTLHVEGAEQSEEMRDTELVLESSNDPACRDVLRFTVLWADAPEFRLTSADVWSDGNDAAARFIESAGDDHLGFHRYLKRSKPPRLPAALGWLVESSAVVHPKDFSYPGVKVAVGHGIESRSFERAPGAVTEDGTPVRSELDLQDESGRYILESANRDDTPDDDGRIYAVAGPFMKDGKPLPPGTVRRFRGNYDAGVAVLYSRKKGVACSERRRFFIALSVAYPTGGGPPELQLGIPFDNLSVEDAEIPLTADLK